MISPLRSVTVIGGGMITHDQLLPSLYRLQREGRIGAIAICGQRASTLRRLVESEQLREAFPGQSFTAYPSLTDSGENVQPELYRTAIGALGPHNIVVVA